MQSEPSAARIRSSPVPPPHATTAMPFSLLYLLKFVPGADPDTDEPSWSSGLVQWRVRPLGGRTKAHNQFGQGEYQGHRTWVRSCCRATGQPDKPVLQLLFGVLGVGFELWFTGPC